MADFPIDVTIKEGKATSDIERLRRSLDGVATSADKLRDSINKNMDSASASTKQFQSVTNNASTATLGLIRNLKRLAGAYLSLQSIQKIISLSSDFQTGLGGVIKTTGLAGSELDRFTERIKSVAREVPVSTAELLELAQTAGQVGVSGAENLEKFSVTVAKLGRASDLSGETAVKSLARILNVTGESVSEIDRLASVIVSLGNNSAASESEIARMTTEVARATSVFGVTSAQASAFGAAMASIGVQAELGGSTVGRVMQEIANVVTAGGKSLDDFSKSLNVNSQELKRLFEDDRIAGFELVLEGIASKGTSAGLALEQVGLGGAQVAKTIIPLANNIDIFRKSLELANAETENATALDREFEATLSSLNSQWKISKNILEGYGRAIGDVLLPPLTKLLSLFNSLNQEAANDPISQQVKKVTDLQERLKTLQTRRDFLGPLAFLGPNKKEFDLLEQQIEDSIDDLARLGPTFETVAKNAGKTETAVGKTSQEIENTGKVSKKAKTEAESFAEALIKEANEAGKTRFEVLRLNAARLGQADSLEPYIRVLEEQARIEREVSEQQRQHENDLRKVEQLTGSARTKQEVYNDELAELSRLLDTGKLSYDTYNKSLQKIEDELHKTENTGRDVFDRLNQFGIQAARNIQTSFADFFFDPFEQGLGGLVSSFGRAIRRMLAEAAALKTIEITGIGSIFSPSSSSSRSGFSLNTNNLLSVVSSGFGVGNLLRAGGSGLSSLVASGASGLGSLTGIGALSSFGAGASGAASAGVFGAGGLNFLGGAGTALGTGAEFGAASSLGAAFSAAAGPLIVAAVADLGLKSIFGNKKLGGTAGDVLSYIPVVGTLINGLFGRGAPKFQNEALVGNVTAGGFEGVLNQAYKEKGGLLKSNRVSNFIADTDTGNLLNQFGRLSESGNIPGALRDSVSDPAIKRALEVGQLLDDTFITLGKTMENTAEILGISSDGLNNFSAELDLISEKGETLSEAQISEAIAGISNQMVSALIPSIDEISRSGETATDTLVRIGAEFQALENALIVSGQSADVARQSIQDLSFEQRAAFTDRFGGAGALSTQVQNFFDNVLDESQQLEIVEDRARSVAESFGLDFIPTLDQLAQGFKDGSAETKALILENDDLIVQYQGLRDAVSDTNSELEEAINKERALAKERNDFTAGRREAQAGGLRPTIATTIQGKIFTEADIRADQQRAIDSAAESATALFQERLNRAGNNPELIRELNATLEFIKFQSGQINAPETASRLSNTELEKQAAAQLKALNQAERIQRNTSFNGSVKFPSPPGQNESADNADRARLSVLDDFKNKMVNVSDSVGGAFSELRDVTKQIVDDLLLSPGVTILNPFQKLSEAFNQFEGTLSLAGAGDSGAISDLPSATKNLVDASLNAATNKVQYDRLVATTIASLRRSGYVPTPKADLDTVVTELKSLKGQIEEMRLSNERLAEQNLLNTGKTADYLRRWNTTGMPGTDPDF